MKRYTVVDDLVAAALTFRVVGIECYLFLVVRLTIHHYRFNVLLRPYPGGIQSQWGLSV